MWQTDNFEQIYKQSFNEKKMALKHMRVCGIGDWGGAGRNNSLWWVGIVGRIWSDVGVTMQRGITALKNWSIISGHMTSYYLYKRAILYLVET